MNYTASDFGKAALFGGLVFGAVFVGLGFLHHGKAALALKPILSAVVTGGIVFAGTNYLYDRHLASASSLPSTASVGTITPANSTATVTTTP